MEISQEELFTSAGVADRTGCTNVAHCSQWATENLPNPTPGEPWMYASVGETKTHETAEASAPTGLPPDAKVWPMLSTMTGQWECVGYYELTDKGWLPTYFTRRARIGDHGNTLKYASNGQTLAAAVMVLSRIMSGAEDGYAHTNEDTGNSFVSARVDAWVRAEGDTRMEARP